jgi:DNA-binding NarL/FixJ family response regulator
LDPLTALEKEIVILAAQGYSNREIAEKLCLVEQTVRNYLSVIYAKTRVKNRVGLTNYAWQQGWMDQSTDADSP